MNDPQERKQRFAELYEPVAPALRAWACLRCRGLLHILDPDDLVQESCLEAYRAVERFDPLRGSFRSWLFGVATRVASAALRHYARRDERTRIEPLESEPLAIVTTISRRVRRSEALERFLEAAALLDEDDRALLVHRGLEGLAHEQIAALLGVSVEVATKRWHRLRKRLQDLPGARDVIEE